MNGETSRYKARLTVLRWISLINLSKPTSNAK